MLRPGKVFKSRAWTPAGRPARTGTAGRAALFTPPAGGLGVVAALAVADRPRFILSKGGVYTQTPQQAPFRSSFLSGARW